MGESIAAVEAGVAAAVCEQPEIRRTLARIAEDERRHAELAWSSLSWLLEREPEKVSPVLHEHAAALQVELGMRSVIDEPASAPGRLGGEERDEIRRAVLASVVRPLLEALAAKSAARPVTHTGKI